MSFRKIAGVRARKGSLVGCGLISIAAMLVAGCGLNTSGGEGAPGPTTLRLAKTAGDGQSGAPGTPLAKPLVVTVRDALGNAVPGRAVAWRVETGGGVLAGTLAVTDARGESRTTFVLGPSAGSNTAVASVASASVSFSETAIGNGEGLTMRVSGFPSRIAVGTPGTTVVTVLDSTGAVFGGYRGTVEITSSDPDASLPPTYVFTEADAGAHSFGVTLNSFGVFRIAAADAATPSLSGEQYPIVAGAGPATRLIVTALADPLSRGAPSDVVVTAVDARGYRDDRYGGTVAFTTTDAGAGTRLPPLHTFSLSDAGAHKFRLGVALDTPGTQTVTATDTLFPTIAGSRTVKVSPTLRVTSLVPAAPKVPIKGTCALTWTLGDGATAVKLHGTGLGSGKEEPVASPRTDTPPAPFPTPPATIDPRAFYRVAATNDSFPREVAEVTQAAQAGGGTAASRATAAFPDGGYAIAGSFAGEMSFSGTTTSPGASSAGAMFVARYRADGSFAWARESQGTGEATAHGVAALADGSLVVVGEYSGTVILGSATLHSAGGLDVFVARYRPDGSLSWARSAGGASDDVASSVSGFLDGSVVVAGHFGGVATFAPGASLESVGGRDIFVARYAPDGSVIRASKAGGGGDDLALGVGAALDGHAIVTGSFRGTAAFGSFSLSSGAGGAATDAFVASFAADGSVVWASHLGSTEALASEGRSVTTFPGGRSAVAGTFRGTATFAGTATTIVSRGGADVFVAAYEPDGSLAWGAGAGGDSDDEGAAVAALPGGRLVVAGSFRGSATFDGAKLVSKGGADAFLCLYEPAGALVWARQVGGATDDSALGVAALASGSAIVAGSFTGTATLGPGVTLEAFGETDAFVARFSPVNSLSLELRPGGFDTAGASSHGQSYWGGDVDYAAVAPFVEGGFVATGTYRGLVPYGPTFGTTTLPGSYASAQYVVRFATDGSVAWARAAWGSSEVFGCGVAAFADGSTVAVSFLSLGSATFGPFTLAGRGMCIVRYSPEGDVTSATLYPNVADPGHPEPHFSFPISRISVCSFPDGGYAVTGNFSSTVTFGSLPALVPVGALDAFVVHWKADGTPDWQASGGAGGEATLANGISGFPDGSLVAVGSFAHHVTFGSKTVSDPTMKLVANQWLVKYDASGAVVWLKGTVDASTPSSPAGVCRPYAGVAAAPDGGCFAGGALSGTTTLGPGEAGATTLTTSSGSGSPRNPYIAKYDADGKLAWAKLATGSADSFGYGVAASPDGRAVVTGVFSGTLTFGAGTTLTAPPFSSWFFLARYGADGVASWAKTGSMEGEFCPGFGVASLTDRSTVVVGAFGDPEGPFSGTFTLGSGEPAVTTLGPANNTEFFFGKYFDY